jgi:hemophore-related protein
MKLLMCTAALGAALFAGTPLAHANEDPAANPPNCSAADLEFARAGVQQATADYLFAHPDVNNFYNTLEGLTRDAAKPKVAAYMKSHPQTKADLTGIRQPLTDIKNRCGATPPPPP